jgi:hypothetical protein
LQRCSWRNLRKEVLFEVNDNSGLFEMHHHEGNVFSAHRVDGQRLF